jgi:arsenate reductase-like glutaredoxin family protein
MANFNSVADFYSDLIQQLGEALRNALEMAKSHAIDYIIVNWYNKYPEKDKEDAYHRLNLMTDSLLSKYELKGNELIAYLYIKDDELHPASNSWNKKPISYEELYKWYHENYGEQDILENTQEYIDEARILVDIIRDTLKSKGYDFE